MWCDNFHRKLMRKRSTFYLGNILPGRKCKPLRTSLFKLNMIYYLLCAGKNHLSVSSSSLLTAALMTVRTAQQTHDNSQ